jgi:hypothetical protein
VLARRIANFMDSAALISFALANSLAQLEQRDVGHVLKVVEDAWRRGSAKQDSLSSADTAAGVLRLLTG